MKRIVLFITALLLFAGCAKEQLVEERSYTGPVTVIEATFESLNNDATKADVTDAGTFTWQNGDKAAFTASTGTAYFTGTNNSSTATASFTITDAPTFTNSSFAFYPSDLTTGQSTSSLAVKVPAVREWVEYQTNVAMYGAKVDGKASFNFTHMGGLVRVRVNNVPTNARKFVFKTPGYKINGDFTAKNVSNYNVIETATSTIESEQTYTLTWTTAPAEENTMDFYIPLPVGTYDNGFAFKFLNETDAEILSKTSSQSETIARKDLVLMPAITLMGGEIEPAEKAAIVQEVPAGHSGDFLLANSEKVLLKVNASDNNKDITLKYNGGELPTNLEIQVVGENAFDKKISGVLPKTHVDFTTGEIANVEMTTSASTFEIIYPATISTKLTVTGGNVKIKGAEVKAIEVAQNAVASKETQAPVQIEMQKYTPTGGTQQTPAVSEKITANADVVVAPESGVDVKVAAAENVQVANEGAGTVKDMLDHPIKTKAAAKIGEVKYITLADAIVAVQNDQTITMLCDVDKANGISVPSGKNFTIDFANYKYLTEKPGAGSTNTKTQAFQLLENSTITFKNGTIGCTEENKNYTWSSSDAVKGVAMIIQNYANLTLENMTIDATNIAHNGTPGTARYAVSNNCGTVEFKGNTTINAPAAGDFAFDVCKSGSYSEPKVTWNSTGSVTGKIELTGGEFVVAKDLALTQPIRTKDAAAKLTVNANITPASGWNAGDALVIVNRTGNLTISGNGKISNNSNANVYSAVKMTESGEAADASEDAKKAKLTVDGTVTLEGDYYGITGNGSRHGTEITVKGGTIRGTHTNDNLGIYHPQEGTLTITNGTIEGYSSAVEMRAGTLNITGGSFTSTASPYDFTQNGSGNTIKGVAIAISEHSTNKGITAKLDGGTFTGGAYQLGVAGLNDRINITKAANLTITVNPGYKWDDNKLVVDAQN